MFSYDIKIKSAVLESEIQNITDGIVKQKLPAGFADLVIYVLSELCANVDEHSSAPDCRIRLNLDSEACVLSMEDNGIGFRNSYLGINKHTKDDRSAIMLALGGLSTKNSNERAFGLHSVRALIEHQRGKMIIKSGTCEVSITNDRMDFKELNKTLGGVHVAIETLVSSINIYNIIR